MEQSHVYKMVIIGDSGVGKSNIMLKFCENTFNNMGATIGVEFMATSMNVDGRNIMIQIWDTAGQERFRAITRSIYHGSKGIFIVFDITRRETFAAIQTWYNELQFHIDIPNVCITLIGNKSDLHSVRAVSKNEAIRLATTLNMTYFETSALDSTNISDAFKFIARSMVQINKNIIVKPITNKKQLVINIKNFNEKREDEEIEVKANKSCCN